MFRKSEKKLKRISKKAILIFSFLPCLNIAALALDTKKTNLFPPTVLQNPLLRNHFTKRFYSIHGVHNIKHPSQFVEDFITHQIEDLLYNTKAKLNGLEDCSAKLKILREHLVQGIRIDNKFKTTWKKTMLEISKYSRELHGSFSIIFFNLPSKNKYKGRIIKDPINMHYNYEFEYLTKQISMASHAIKTYFFEQEGSIHFNDLRYTNMLISLYHAQKLAQRLSKEF